jgi:DNA helicase HerA-like ATPase
MLIVIDDAHNFCPAEPDTPLQANATEYCVNIAAEGRKFGLYLLISTQRPSKVHRNVLSQCDNIMLMRMNSRADLAEISGAFSFVAPSLIEESMRFRQGETLIAGKIVPTPLIARVSGRISAEGGADVPPTWANL